MRQPTTTGRLITTQERRAFELELRKSGLTYRRIADATINHFGIENLPKGYDSRYAYTDVKRELEKLKAQVAEDAKEILQVELERLDRMLVGLWPNAAAGDVAAVNAVLRIMDRRANYLDLDTAQRIIIDDWRDKFKEAGVDWQEIYNAMVDAAAERMKAAREDEQSG